MNNSPTNPSRIVSLDQFRGYTVLGMFLVNFIGGYEVIRAHWPVLKHWHTYCSYADTIMPHFLFAVGFAFRLTLLRRIEAGHAWEAYSHAIRRNLGLFLLAIVYYHLDGSFRNWSDLQEKFAQQGFWHFVGNAFWREPFQTLAHIAVTSLWVLPVIAARPSVRIAWMIGSAALHVWLSHWFYYAMVMGYPGPDGRATSPAGIDGGVLGFLTWTTPLLVGSLAYDLVAARGSRAAVWPLFAWGVAVMLLGYGLANLNLLTPPNADPSTPLSEQVKALPVEPPFVPPTRPVNYWTMSQRAGSVSYLVFGAGISLAVYALFVLACDVWGWRLGVFGTFGSNALAAYIIHGLVDNAISPFVPRDAPGWYVAAALAVFLGICYLFVRHLEKNRLFLKL